VKIWDLQEDVNIYEHLTLVDGSPPKWNEFTDMFRGRHLSSNWERLKLKQIEHGGNLKKGDMPYLSPGVPVFSIKAIDTLKHYLNNNAEILDIECDIGDYKIINIINLISCLDYEMSEIKYYPNSERIMRIKKYVFDKEKVVNEHIFKIIEQPRATIFVSDEFRDKVIESGLEGFKFIEVWDSEE
jgi:hypothetical protein